MIADTISEDGLVQETFATHLYGRPGWDNVYPFVNDVMRRRRFHEDGQMVVVAQDGRPVTLAYHFFNNSYTHFVFFPAGEKNPSRVTFVDRALPTVGRLSASKRR